MPPHRRHPSVLVTVWRSIKENLNFFRIHLLLFTFIPLIASIVLYACNGTYPISYVDALFNSVSAMTVCGLTTVNLSGLTPWQQVILFLQMCIGSPVVVSWIMVYTRRYFFAKKFNHIVQAEAVRQAARMEARLSTEASATASGEHGWSRRVSSLLRRRPALSTLPEDELTGTEGSGTPREKEGERRLRPDMIRRMDAPPRLINPSGRIIYGAVHEEGRVVANPSVADTQTRSPEHPIIESNREPAPHITIVNKVGADSGNGPSDLRLSELQNGDASLPTNLGQSREINRTATVDFSPIVARQDLTQAEADGDRDVHGTHRRRRSIVPSTGAHIPMAQHPTGHTHRSTRGQSILEPQQHSHIYRDFGGFPMPHEILGRFLGWLFPKARRGLQRTMTIPVTTTLTGVALGRTHSGSTNVARDVPYISFDAVVGRNSAFRSLTNEQLEELGGVEYRALNALLWIVAIYHIGIQTISFVIIAPYMSTARWSSDFQSPALVRTISPAWFSLFQVVSAYTNTGFSLVDQSMIPFQTAYLMIVILIICILAGNTAFPIFLRLSIWIVKKSVPVTSRLHQTLHFLLDHPRRCFIYLFPSHQTWFLLTMLLILNLTDWLCFLILDIGNPAIQSIPVGTRTLAGFYQAIAVRNAGFGIVPLAVLSPAVKVMYVIMMYISVYPIALSVRSTNVYEEQSLGVFRDEDSDEEDDFEPTGSRIAIWGRYLTMHARRQLSFDMWWLSLALFLVCIIERDNLDNTSIQSWFNIFTIQFELVSAYGSVGLSLGADNQNYSFSGTLRPLSKLVICLVMLRGRHRGLPVAIDRAIMLPLEFNDPREQNSDPRPPADEARATRHSTSGAHRPFEGPSEACQVEVEDSGTGRDEMIH